ncbi:MAG: DUF4159 domain-containing protein [Planctomycetes bacterium]|nr:DUF4159 domain-containing protein [Planctomycetota bacterium]
MRLAISQITGIVALFAFTSNAAAQRSADIPLTDQNIEKSITKAVEYIFSRQKDDGSWPPYEKGQPPSQFIYKEGPTAMSIYALVASGVPAKDPRIAKALDWMVKPENQCDLIYSVAFRCMAWYTVNKQLDNKYMKQLSADTDLLIKAGPDGLYNYTCLARDVGDSSNSQYGLYGVWTGARAGIEINKDYWDKCLKRWIKAQNDDGGWGYYLTERRGEGTRAASYGGMTVAGIASLFVCIDWLHMDKFIKCQVSSEIAAVKKGLDWMDKNFPQSLRAQPPYGFNYYFYGVERVGLASGYKYFGATDWYKAGASWLLNSQQPDGHWLDEQVHGTNYGLLFLIRGRLPVLINRLEYNGDWNNRPRALANFCRWSEKTFETESNWQIITLKSDVNEWHDAPILTITGSKDPKFSAEDIEKLRAFVHQGGMLFSITECGGTPFGTGMKNLYKKLFPRYELAACGRDHPLNTLLYKSGAAARFSEISNGIRPLAIHSDVDLPVSWQQYQVATAKSSFEAAANVVMYVTDKQFRFRGSKVWPDQAPADRKIKAARIRYAGNYDPEPLALERLSRLMAQSHKIQIDYDSAISASAPALQGATPPASSMPITGILTTQLTADIKLAFLTGTGGFKLPDDEKEALKKWADAGGLLVMDAAGGGKGFTDSAKELLAELYGPDALLPMPMSSPIYQMKDMTIEKVRYRKTTRSRIGGMTEPRLMSVQDIDKPKVILSAEDLTAGMVGYSSWGLDGYDAPSAFNIIRNIVVYVMMDKPVR